MKRENLAHCLQLIHFHIGSQVPDIGTIKRAVREAARFYAKLEKMGHPLGYLDVGGGLGVDYDGSSTTFDSSTNYSLQEYARDIVYNIMDVCDSEKVAHPVIISARAAARLWRIIPCSWWRCLVPSKKTRLRCCPMRRRTSPGSCATCATFTEIFPCRTGWKACTTRSKSRSKRRACSISGCLIS